MIRVWIFALILNSCSAIIRHLNDTEYERMPPLFSLDEYEPCLVEEDGAYCMLQLHIYAQPENQLMHMINEYSDRKLKHYDHSVIDRGLCVRKTCQKYISKLRTTEEITNSLESCLNDSLHRDYGLNAKVSKLYYCDHHNEPLHIDAWDWTVLLLILALVIVNIVGSLYDYFTNKQMGLNQNNVNSILLSFSIQRNWGKLTKTETDDSNSKELQFLHGARVISSFCTVLLHVLMSITMGFTRNYHDIEKTYEMSLYYLIYGGLNIVHIFFFISGFLTVYHLQMEEQKRTLSIWDVPKIMLLRLSRLVPVLAVVLALTTTWLRHLGSGPLWKLHVTDSLVADCRNCWWHHLFFINNYMQKGRACLLPTWHLASDIQVFLIGVTAYFVSRRVLLPALLVLGVVSPALHTLYYDLDVHVLTPNFFRSWESPMVWQQHVLGHNNLTCFVIGMFTAALLYRWQKKDGHIVLRRWYVSVQYLAVVSIPALQYSGRWFFYEGRRAGVLARASYIAATRLAVGVACAVIAPVFFSKTPSHLRSLFEWRHWVVPSRLTYCVFLINMLVVHVMAELRKELVYYSFNNVMVTTCFVMLASYLIAVPLCLAVEAPFIALMKILAKNNTLAKTAQVIDDTKDKAM